MAKANTKLTLDMSQPIFVGIDVHKKSWSVSLLHCDQMIGRFTLKSDFEQLRKILQRYSDMKILSVYEAGFSGFHLHFQLESIGVKNIVTPPSKIPLMSGDKVKTDKRGSLKLASFLSKGLLKGIYIPTQEQLNLRQILRTREQIKIKKTRAINQIKGLLLLYGIHSDARGISKQGAACILELDLPPMVKMSIRLHLQEIELINNQLKELEKEYLKVKESETFKKTFHIIHSVPGIGPLIATSLTYEIGDWRRFNNENQVAAFFGLTPAEYSSDESIRRGRITGQGNPTLRSFLIQASWVVVDKDSNMKLFFERITKQTGSKKKAIVAVARKLICRIFSMIKNNKEYEVCSAVCT